ncbi:MAG: hypothetical protein JWQ40_3809 [Segetibacter sp.]|nr:hypothetical protein [Segetibacter sp.]
MFLLPKKIMTVKECDATVLNSSTSVWSIMFFKKQIANFLPISIDYSKIYMQRLLPAVLEELD